MTDKQKYTFVCMSVCKSKVVMCVAFQFAYVSVSLKRWVVYWHIMVTHTESRRFVNSHGIVPVSLRYGFHSEVLLTVHEGEVRVETDLNLP